MNTTKSQMNTTAVDYSEDACTPKYFVFNSQVRLFERRKTPEELKFVPKKESWVIFGRDFWIWPSCSPDCLCCSHPDLRFRVSPCHPAHVRGAQRVSARWFFFSVFSHFLNSRAFSHIYIQNCVQASKWNILSSPARTAAPTERCRTLPMYPSWPCSSCTCWPPSSDIWPSTVSSFDSEKPMAFNVYKYIHCMYGGRRPILSWTVLACSRFCNGDRWNLTKNKWEDSSYFLKSHLNIYMFMTFILITNIYGTNNVPQSLGNRWIESNKELIVPVWVYKRSLSLNTKCPGTGLKACYARLWKTPPGAADHDVCLPVCYGRNIWANVQKCSRKIKLVIQEHDSGHDGAKPVA